MVLARPYVATAAAIAAYREALFGKRPTFGVPSAFDGGGDSFGDDTGDMGPPGPRGADGVAGSAGTPGTTGAAGAFGPPGMDGEPGEDGPMGPSGLRGLDGAAGAPGSTGAAGAVGPPGPPGFGEDGEDGVMGPPGLRGADGAAGAPGATGTASTVEPTVSSDATFRGKFTITDAAITATSKVSCWQAPGPYGGKGTRADEAEMQPISVVSVEPAAGSAVVRWQTPPIVVSVPVATTGNLGSGTAANNGDNRDQQFTACRLGKARGKIRFHYVVYA